MQFLYSYYLLSFWQTKTMQKHIKHVVHSSAFRKIVNLIKTVSRSVLLCLIEGISKFLICWPDWLNRKQTIKLQLETPSNQGQEMRSISCKINSHVRNIIDYRNELKKNVTNSGKAYKHLYNLLFLEYVYTNYYLLKLEKLRPFPSLYGIHQLGRSIRIRIQNQKHNHNVLTLTPLSN